MVDSMNQIFLLKPEVLTRNRNGFMAKKRKWHLKAGSTVVVLLFSSIFTTNVVLFGTHKTKFLKLILFQTTNSTSFTGFSVKMENHWL